MKRFHVALLVSIVASGFCASAVAAYEDDLEYHRSGFYLIGGVALGFENSKDLDNTNDDLDDLLDAIIDIAIDDGDLPPGTTGSGKLDISVMPGVNVAGGYRISPHIAVEAEFEWARANVDLDIKLEAPGFEDASDSSKVAEYSYWLLSANVKFYALTKRFQPFALIGVGVMNQEIDFDDGPEDDETGIGLRFGGGADLYLSLNVALTADFTYVVSEADLEDNDIMSLNVGALWRF